MRTLLLILLTACAPAPSDDPTVETDETDVETDTPEAPGDFWSIDDDVRTPLYGSLNCQMAGDRLYLNGAESGGGMGTLQLQLGDFPAADGAYTVSSEPAAPGGAYLSIGVDREQENQYVASGGVLNVVVVTSPSRAVEVTFTDLPSATEDGATALLSGRVGAREGTFLGACDFDDL
jgi:hypothetical protein